MGAGLDSAPERVSPFRSLALSRSFCFCFSALSTRGAKTELEERRGSLSHCALLVHACANVRPSAPCPSVSLGFRHYGKRVVDEGLLHQSATERESGEGQRACARETYTEKWREGGGQEREPPREMREGAG